eukprot:gnl/TRDRNA2_/TRDRNA2_190611_c0_seq1.p1 gnl/TRDRNA2_/TRDRNA2_190611_c0~~gnl/TRDRNA2_/TRDRNA2_190611_c0_seq1.p1  ORF type:complete len:399 (-),score=43.36 gnl/TRDRNA2_/TRDRNA2_190611_c0_seq1:27-1169(-)
MSAVSAHQRVAGCSHGYIKIRDIGQGSYGKAMLVQDEPPAGAPPDSEGKLYVMKTIDMSSMDKKQRRDAINEVRVLSSLKHPYIVSYRESFTEGSTLAIVMDYAEGGDLYQRISRIRKAHQTLSERQILRWFTEAALALKYMHDKHVLHRDLKSQNLFLTSSDRLRVGDFGISKVLESTAAFARTAIGTPYYLSPEICQDRPYSFGSDVWALGCVLYEMAALRVPFDAQNIQALVQKITRGPTPLLPAQYSAELRQLCGDLLHRDQAQRPSASEIIQRRHVQDEIRRMLQEEKSKTHNSATPSAAGSQPPQYAGGSQPASVSGGAGPRAPSPARRPSSYRSAHSPSPQSRVYAGAQGSAADERGRQYPSRDGTPGAHRRY